MEKDATGSSLSGRTPAQDVPRQPPTLLLHDRFLSRGTFDPNPLVFAGWT
jgi:hypothetical protein